MGFDRRPGVDTAAAAAAAAVAEEEAFVSCQRPAADKSSKFHRFVRLSSHTYFVYRLRGVYL